MWQLTIMYRYVNKKIAGIIIIGSNDGDFIPNVCQLVFLAGSGPGTTMDCKFTIIDDNLVEVIENFYVFATVTSGMASFASHEDEASIHIIDNDGKKF